MSLLTFTQAAMEQAVTVINSIGTTCYYTPKSTGIPIKLKVVTREMGNAELVGDYRQGDLRIELDASTVPGIPKKYDELKIGDLTYAVLSPGGSPRRVGDKVYTYKFVVRGG